MVKIKSVSMLSLADGIKCARLKAAMSRPIGEWVLDVTPIGLRSAALSRTHQLFGVFGKFRHGIYVIQPDQSSCGRMAMSLGSLSKMPE